MTDDKSATNALDHLLADSRAGAEMVEQGNFRLDWTRALDKVKNFQLTDPHRYVLELAQCAIAGGASAIDVQTDADDVIVTYDAPYHDREQLSQLFDYLFSQDRSMSQLKQLALAVNSALALAPKFVTVESGDGSTGHRLQLTSHHDVSIEPLQGDNVLRGTRVHVRDRLTWRVLIEFFRSRTAEGKHLAESCFLAPIPVRLDGRDVVRDFEPNALMRRPFSTGSGLERIHGEVVLPDKPRDTAEVHILMNGVRVVVREIERDQWLGSMGYVAYVDSRLLSRNASHSDVVLDKQFKRAMTAVKRAARALLIKWLERTLLDGEPLWRDDVDALSPSEQHYVGVAMRLVLRVGRGRLSRSSEALLDVPGVVELAVRRPKRSSLRAVWNAYRQHKACYVAERRYDIDLRDVTDGIVPILGPDWVVKQVFAGKRRDADELLRVAELGLQNRRERERLAREPVFGAGDVIAKVSLEHKGHEISGELGVRRPKAATHPLPWLARPITARTPPDSKYHVRVLFLRDGVPLGERFVDSHLAHAVAIVDSPVFEPNEAWNDLIDNAASASVTRLISRAIPALLERMCADFARLPPPLSILEAGYFDGEEYRAEIPGALSALWPSDGLSEGIRWHVDNLLQRRGKLSRQRAPWLWRWPMFHTLDGTAVDMTQILEERPGAADSKDAPRGAWRYTVDAAWGEGTPANRRMINVTVAQRAILSRYLGSRIKDGSTELKISRLALQKRKETEMIRRRNMAAARVRRQEPRLHASSYLALVDLEIEDGAGQVGIPRFGGKHGHIRFLVGDLPLCDVELSGPLPLHAVVQSDRIEPDVTFAKLASPAVVKSFEQLVVSSVRRLIEELANAPDVKTSRGRQLIWQFLNSVSPNRKDRLSVVPDAILDLPLLPTVDRGEISIRAMIEDANDASRVVLVAARSLGRQLQKRPILLLNGDKQRIVRKLFNLRVNDYTRSLQLEEDILARLDQPRKPPTLQQPTTLVVDIDEQGVRGQVGFPRLMASMSAKQAGQWLDFQQDGVPIERVPWSVYGASLVGVLDASVFLPNRNWDAVRRNAAFKLGKRIAKRAAERLFALACSEVEQNPFIQRDAASMVDGLQELAVRRFQGTPELHLDNASEMERALAEAPLWSSAEQGKRHCLADIAEQWQRTGVVWVVDDERGHVHPERIIVHGDATVRKHLRQVFGDRVRDGASVLRRDDAAYRRRMNAPGMALYIPAGLVMESVMIDRELNDANITVQGHVALHREYRGAAEDLVLTIGLDGRVLCTRTVQHPLRGLAYLDCRGLKPNRDWDGIADDRQMASLSRMATRALWDAAVTVVENSASLPNVTSNVTSSDWNRRAMFLDILATLVEDERKSKAKRRAIPKRALLTGVLDDVSLFSTVTGQALSLSGIRASVKEVGHLLAVSNRLDAGEPSNDQVIIRSDDAGLTVLKALFGHKLRRYDDRWETELEGRRRRRQALRVEPHLQSDVATKVFVQNQGITVLIGLCRPSADKRFDDDGDAMSKVHLHVDHRKVTHRSVRWHPAVEVWANDDRLTPTPDFRDIVDDEQYEQVVALIQAQFPELLARAAASCLVEPTQALRMRLCHYALDRWKSLSTRASGDVDDPIARFLDARMWPCLTSAGAEILSTTRLLQAHKAGRLVTVDSTAPARAVEQDVVAVRAAAVEVKLLRRTLGKLKDYTDTLHMLEAHRRFMERSPVAAVDLGAIGVTQSILWRHAIDKVAWEGEFSISMHIDRGIDVRVFLEHRPLTSLVVPAPVHAICAVQWTGIEPTSAYDGIASGASRKQFDTTVEHVFWDALSEMAQALDEMSIGERRHAVRVLLTALASYREHTKKSRSRTGSRRSESALVRLVDTLMAALLIVDTTGRWWSVTALRDAHGGKPVATVSPESTQSGAGLEDKIVLVLDGDDFSSVARLMQVMRYDDTYLEGVAARKRMERAPLSHKMPRHVLCEASVDAGPLRGQLALDRDPQRSELGLMSHGRLVEVRSFAHLPGLIGYLDGDLETDKAFERVVLKRLHEQRLTEMYQERLEAAVALAVAFKGRRSSSTWRALRVYVCMYLQAHLDDMGHALAERREHILEGHGSVPKLVRDALGCQIFEMDSGAHVDVATLVVSPRPIVVRLRVGKKRRKRAPDTLLVGDNRDIVLLSALLGASSVFEYEHWLASQARAAQQAQREREQQEQLTVSNMLTRLRLALREAASEQPRGRVTLARIGGIVAGTLGNRELAVRDDDEKDIVVNQQHPLWGKVSAGLSRDPDEMFHFAAAVITELAIEDEIDERGALEMLAGLAQHAALLAEERS